MLQEAAALGDLTLDSLKSIRLTRSNRAIIAKALGILYRELGTLVDNGSGILRMLRANNNGKRIDLNSLEQLLKVQEVIIQRINTELQRSKLKTVLSIRTPKLQPIQVIVDTRGERIELLLDRMKPERRRFQHAPYGGWFRYIHHVELQLRVRRS